MRGNGVASVNDLAEHEQERAERAEAAAASSLQVADLAGFAEMELAPPRFALEPLVPSGLVTLLAAHGGAGKSILALSIAAHFAAGRTWAGFTPSGGRVLFVTLEDSREIVLWRLRKVVAAHGLEPADLEGAITIADGSGDDAALVSEVNASGVRKLAETANLARLEQLATGTGLIVIDNASDGFDGDENSRRQVRHFVRRLGHIARANDAGLILLAHLDKNAAKHGAAGNSYSGSTAWHNSARSRMAIIEKDGRPQLVHEKANLGPKADPVPLEWTDAGVLVPSNTTHAADQEVVQQARAQDADAVLTALEAAETSQVPVPAARTGSSTAWHALKTFDELPRVLSEKSGRDRFWSAVGELERTGRAHAREERAPNRHKRTVLKPGPRA